MRVLTKVMVREIDNVLVFGRFLMIIIVRRKVLIHAEEARTEAQGWYSCTCMQSGIAVGALGQLQGDLVVWEKAN